MSHEKNIDAIVVELDQIYETYQRYTGFNAKRADTKRRHQAEEDAITSATRNKMKACEEKIRAASKITSPSIDKAIYTPIPVVPKIPTSTNHRKTIMLGAVSGLAIPVGLAVYLLCMFISEFLSMLGGALLLGGLFAWILLGGYLAVEGYLAWQKDILEYDQQVKDWECEYSKLDINKNADKLLADVAVYEKECLSIVKDCDGKFEELFKEMMQEKNKLAKQQLAEHEQLDQEWNEICSQLESVTLIHSDLFYIAWRISSALQKGRADTLKEAINIAINDERLAQEEAARRAEAQRQEAIAAEMARRAEREARKATEAAREQARQAEYAARAQAREAEEAARRRCLTCVNYNKCSYTVQKNSLSCAAFTPK